MTKTVDVTIPVDSEASEILKDDRNRKAIGRLVSRVLHASSGATPLARAIKPMKAGARAAGVTDAEIEAELAAYNVE